MIWETLTEQGESLTEHSKSLTEHSKSLTEHSKRLTEHSESLTEHRESFAEHSKSLTEHRETLTEHTKTLTEHSESLTEHSESLAEQADSFINHQEIPIFIISNQNLPTFGHSFNMRNTTKLKNLLLKYNADFSMDDDFHFKLSIFDKVTGESQLFEGDGYAKVLQQAHSYMLKRLKNELNNER